MCGRVYLLKGCSNAAVYKNSLRALDSRYPFNNNVVKTLINHLLIFQEVFFVLIWGIQDKGHKLFQDLWTKETENNSEAKT